MVQTTWLLSGTHLALPTEVLNLGESASAGTGTDISTLFAVERRLNWLLACDKHNLQIFECILGLRNVVAVVIQIISNLQINFHTKSIGDWWKLR